jgi:hypothetical protein
VKLEVPWRLVFVAQHIPADKISVCDVESRLYILLCLQLNFLSSRSCDIGCHSALLKVV